ncbi:hypothetical protein GCM10027051_21110 [Niabella terrae]
MKKLDKLIIKAFFGPFVATFFITLFVLVMQFFWLWIDDFVGKGLDAGTIMKFIWYQSAVLIPLALPLSVLLSSLMTFGNLGESFELVAIKSAGISLLRFMRPLFLVTVLISLGAFLFSNYVIPVATLKSRTLLGDIVLSKPAFAIKEGVFFDGIDKFAIKIGKKEANDSIIRDVIVYENSNNNLQDNFIIARDGVMKPSPDKRFLDVVFKNGWRYQERGNRSDSSTEYIRLGFKEYKMQLDISSFQVRKSDDSSNVNEKMYNMRQLNVAIDSMSREYQEARKRYSGNLLGGLSMLVYKDSVPNDKALPDSVLNFKKNRADYLLADSSHKDSVAAVQKPGTDTARDGRDSLAQADSSRIALQGLRPDSLNNAEKAASDTTLHDGDSSRKAPADTSRKTSLLADTAKKAADSLTRTAAAAIKKDPNGFDALLPDSARQQVRERALSILNSVKSNIEMNASYLEDQQKTLQKYKIEWHRKIALAAACIVLFMIGAPLGSIIRKGGLGSPLIFAIVFFMVFYFVSTRGEKLAKEGQMSAFTGMWLATFVLVPVGIFLTYKAMHDSNLFNKEFYNRLKRRLFKKMNKSTEA